MQVVENPFVPDGEGVVLGGVIFVSPASFVELQKSGVKPMNAAVSEAIMSNAETNEADVIVEIVQTIEQLDENQLFDGIRGLLDEVDLNYFQIGGRLARISEEGLWDSEKYESFRQAVEEETGIHYRKAMYLMSIYNDLVEAEIPWEKIKVLAWSKLKEISSILTAENVDEWVAKIMGPPELTVMQIQELVKQFKLGSLNKNSDEVPEETSTVTSISFKVHSDQKETIKMAVEKAKGEAETEYDGVALEAICMGYLAGGKAQKPKPLSEHFKSYQPDEVLEAFAVCWPDIDVTAKM